MKRYGFDRLKSIVKDFNGIKVLVVGDLILDEFIWGKVSRISPEAPVPVVWVDSENFMPGGASNVAVNIASLGGQVYVAGAVGRDERGKLLKGILRKKRINTSGIVTDTNRPTTLKTRIIAQNQQVVRVDREKIDDLSPDSLRRIIKFVRKIIKKIDVVLIEDYGKGVIVPGLITEVIDIARRNKKLITVDPKTDHINLYKKVTAITPNKQEASLAAGVKLGDGKELGTIGRRLLKRLGCNMVLITLGEDGMVLFEKGKRATHIPTIAQEVFDVSGAGDTVVSAFTIALGAGASPLEAAHIANCAAGIVVGKVGTAMVNRTELIRRIKEEIAQD
ncbi:MAG: D-glycero-beta-D-manno-heptose-7-phosphate kinase [Candidatus Omnitrophica bacterium]|nr:D-glycero-beta-D-manno-heptose-7-phosphate kinase [Candidatus Omnitrophota bacterium]